VVVAVLFAQGDPWKRSALSNWQFSVWVVISLAASTALLCSPYLEPGFFRSDDLSMPWSWRRSIGAYVLLYFACAILWDIVFSPLFNRFGKKYMKSGRPMGMVFGRLKALDQGKGSKLYHRMRGEFEANWEQQNYY
jgi:hypothetical protein